MARSLLIHWKKLGPSTDIIPVNWLTHNAPMPAKKHWVEWSGRRVWANCDITVAKGAGDQRVLNLDYENHNQDENIDLGVLRLILNRANLITTKVFWKDKGKSRFNDVGNEIELEISEPVASDKAEPPKRVKFTTSRIIRDTAVALWVKEQHNYKCQICRHTILLSKDVRYAEAHHIQPLGGEHRGPDVSENILCLCPNHHAELDYRIRRIELHELRRVDDHAIDEKYIAYHNENLYLAE